MTQNFGRVLNKRLAAPSPEPLRWPVTFRGGGLLFGMGGGFEMKGAAPAGGLPSATAAEASYAI
jgi:hypothetical protein